MIKQDIQGELYKAYTEDICLPILIPSYNRWKREDSVTLSKLLASCSERVRKNVYVFVRPEQEQLYKDSYRDLGYNIVALPEINGVRIAYTRQCLLNFAHYNGMTRIMSMDDDLTHLYYIYEKADGYAHHNTVDENWWEGVVHLGCKIALQCFEENSNAVLGGFRKRRFCQNIDNARVKYWVNGGQTPRAVTFFAVDRMFNNGIYYNMAFDPTGDDIGICAEILKAGKELFSIPSLAYWMTDETKNSVIRNDDNRKLLAQYEYNCLCEYPIKDYLSVAHKYEDGQYAFGDISWQKYHKINNTKGRKTLW